MTRRVAIPVFMERVSSRADCAESILLVTIEDGKIVRHEEIRWGHANPVQKIHLLMREGVDVLICGGLPETYANMLHETSIEVIPWVRGDVEKVLLRFAEGRLRATTTQQNEKGHGNAPAQNNEQPEL